MVASFVLIFSALSVYMVYSSCKAKHHPVAAASRQSGAHYECVNEDAAAEVNGLQQCKAAVAAARLWACPRLNVMLEN